MATKSEIRAYAKNNNVSMAEAKQHFINEAKQNNPKQGKLVGFYWGYRANNGSNGFEFSSFGIQQLGMSHKQALTIGQIVKESVDYQVNMFRNKRTQEELGMSEQEFLDEEWDRLIGTTENLNILVKTPGMTLGNSDFTSNLIIWACAVSTMVAAGKIEQDEWNGDKFFYADNNLAQTLAA